MRNPTKSRDVAIQLEASLIAASRRIGCEVARMVIAQLLRRLAAYEPALLSGQVPPTCIFLIPHLGDSSAATSICFGAFCLWPVRRLLLQDNQPVRIGSRALEILIALPERPGELLSEKELMARVWPDTFV
jgi:DNA-binding response OmpR family regulator